MLPALSCLAPRLQSERQAKVVRSVTVGQLHNAHQACGSAALWLDGHDFTDPFSAGAVSVCGRGGERAWRGPFV